MVFYLIDSYGSITQAVDMRYSVICICVVCVHVCTSVLVLYVPCTHADDQEGQLVSHSITTFFFDSVSR